MHTHVQCVHPAVCARMCARARTPAALGDAQALLQLVEDLAWEEPEASAADVAATSAQPGVAHRAEAAPPNPLARHEPPGVGGSSARGGAALQAASQG